MPNMRQSKRRKDEFGSEAKATNGCSCASIIGTRRPEQGAVVQGGGAGQPGGRPGHGGGLGEAGPRDARKRPPPRRPPSGATGDPYLLAGRRDEPPSPRRQHEAAAAKAR